MSVVLYFIYFPECNICSCYAVASIIFLNAIKICINIDTFYSKLLTVVDLYKFDLIFFYKGRPHYKLKMLITDFDMLSIL